MKRAQMEIVGLLVVVILIVLIIFFSLAFTANKKDENIILNFQDQQIASQLGNVMLETTIECGNTQRTIRRLAINCATENDIRCDEQNACEKLNETILSMTNETLAKNLEYKVTILDSNEDKITNIITPKCETTLKNRKPYNTIFGAGDIGSLTLTIALCY